VKKATISSVEFIKIGATLTLLSGTSVLQLETASQSLPSIILLSV
jgi:hypothetical protein